MTRTFGLTFLAMTSVLTITILASEKPTLEFQNDMKTALDVLGNAGLRTHVPAKDYDALVKDAATFKTIYVKMLPFWTQRKAEDAIKFTRDGTEAAMALETAAKAKDEAGIVAAVTRLSQTCGDCHNTHRAQLPGKTYEIK